MAEKKHFSAGEVIFKQGAWSNCAYELLSGRVGIYLSYGTADQRELTVLDGSGYFGEIGALDGMARSATAVALTEGTEVTVLSVEDINEIFRSDPDRLLEIFHTTSTRLRALSADYAEACETISAYVSGARDTGIRARLRRMLDYALDLGALYQKYAVPDYSSFYGD